jgi:hypothetical protein
VLYTWLAYADRLNVYDLPNVKFVNVYVGPDIVYELASFVLVIVYPVGPWMFRHMSESGIYGFALVPVNTLVRNVAVNSEKDAWNVGGPGRPGKTLSDNGLGALLIPCPYDVTIYVYADPVVQLVNMKEDRFVVPLIVRPKLSDTT